MLAFVVGFAMIAAVLEWLLPPAYVSGLTPKLWHTIDQRGKYDVAFIGSSRVFRHFDATEFDREMAAAGHPVRSFNFGIDGMAPPESFYVLRQTLAEHPGLRWVFIELWDLRTVAVERLANTARFTHWHDPRSTSLVIRRIFGDQRLDFAEKLSRVSLHFRSAFLRNSHLGRGSEMLALRLNPRRKNDYKEPTPWLATAGFVPNPGKPFEGKKKAEYAAAAEYIRTKLTPVHLAPAARDATAALARAVRESGAVPVFVVMPTVNAGENYASLREHGIDAETITLAQPHKFPELYDVNFHQDDWHFTEEGARHFTHYLAGEFRTLLEAKLAFPPPR